MYIIGSTMPKSSIEPYWWDDAPLRVLPEQPVQAASDLVIVGAGYAGLSAALVAVRAGRSVQVFDRMIAGEGASSRNGGIASGNLAVSLQKMIKTLGRERAVAIYREGITARLGLAAFIEHEGIACDYAPVGRFTGATSRKDYDGLGRTADLINRHLDLAAYVVSRQQQHREIGTDYYFGGLVRPDIGGLHPAKFNAGLLAKVVAEGGIVHGETAVTGVVREGGKFDVGTARGCVRAGNVIVTTNGYTDQSNRWLRRRLIPIPSRMIATDPVAPEVMARLMPKRRMCGETNRLFHYFRPSPDGRRILLGGREGVFKDTPDAFADHLKADLNRIFPELTAVGISHSWSGNIAYNLDFLPRLFVRDGVRYAVGFCGSGVIWAWWLGRQAGLQAIGDRSAASLFNCDPPKALPLYNGRPWFLPLAIGWYGLQDRLKGRKSQE